MLGHLSMIFLCGLTLLPFIFHICSHLYWHLSHLFLGHAGQEQEYWTETWGRGLRDGGGVDRGWQSMVLCSMSPRDATCLLSCFVTPCPAAPRRHKCGKDVEQRTALMYPELMFNESSIFRQVHAKRENGFVLFWNGMRRACVLCVGECLKCQICVYKSLQCPEQEYLLIYSCSEHKQTVSWHASALHEVLLPLSSLLSSPCTRGAFFH